MPAMSVHLESSPTARSAGVPAWKRGVKLCTEVDVDEDAIEKDPKIFKTQDDCTAALNSLKTALNVVNNMPLPVAFAVKPKMTLEKLESLYHEDKRALLSQIQNLQAQQEASAELFRKTRDAVEHVQEHQKAQGKRGMHLFTVFNTLASVLVSLIILAFSSVPALNGDAATYT